MVVVWPGKCSLALLSGWDKRQFHPAVLEVDQHLSVSRDVFQPDTRDALVDESTPPAEWACPKGGSVRVPHLVAIRRPGQPVHIPVLHQVANRARAVHEQQLVGG